MLKAVSSITNAIGALNYIGTWNASTNTPTITSSVGTKGDYYQVSVAGSTTINGISNWGVGDVIAFNGVVWQRIEGGADLNGVDLSVSGTTTLSGLTASTALALDANKNVVSVTNTGTGDNVLATSPTLVTPALGAATATSINKVALTAPATGSTLTIADGKTLTASNTLTFTGTDTSSVAFGTGGTVAYTTDKLSAFAATTSSELAGVISDETGSGLLVFATSPTLTTPTLGVAAATSINKVALTAPATAATLTIADGKTLTANQSLTLAGTDATTMTFPTTSATVARTDAAQSFTGDQTLATDNLVIGTTAKGIDVTPASVAVANNGTIDFPNSSGFLVVNSASTGGSTIYLSGGGGVTVVANNGSQVGTLAFNAGIGGYTWTNNSGSTALFGFFFVRLRVSA
jgi:hypothetical protein